MTRKDYDKFAALFAGEVALAKEAARTGNSDLGLTIRNIIFSTADIFAHDNVRFDRDKFYKACGIA